MAGSAVVVERQETGILPKLREIAQSAAGAESRLHALLTLDGLGAMNAELMGKVLDDPEPRVREHSRAGHSW